MWGLEVPGGFFFVDSFMTGNPSRCGQVQHLGCEHSTLAGGPLGELDPLKGVRLIGSFPDDRNRFPRCGFWRSSRKQVMLLGSTNDRGLGPAWLDSREGERQQVCFRDEDAALWAARQRRCVGWRLRDTGKGESEPAARHHGLLVGGAGASRNTDSHPSAFPVGVGRLCFGRGPGTRRNVRDRVPCCAAPYRSPLETGQRH